MNFLKFNKLNLLLSLLIIIALPTCQSTPDTIKEAVASGSVHGASTVYLKTGNDKLSTIKLGADTTATDTLPAVTATPGKPIFAKNFEDLDTLMATNKLLFVSDDADCYGYTTFKGLHFALSGTDINVMVADFCYPKISNSNNLSDVGYCDDTTKVRTMDGRCVTADSTDCGSTNIKPGAAETPSFILRTPYDGNFCIKFTDLTLYYQSQVFTDQAGFNEKMFKTKFVVGGTAGNTTYVLKPTAVAAFDGTITIIPENYAFNYMEYDLLVADANKPVAGLVFKINPTTFPDTANPNLYVFPFDSSQTNVKKKIVVYKLCATGATSAVLGIDCTANTTNTIEDYDAGTNPTGSGPYRRIELPSGYLKNTMNIHKHLYIQDGDCTKSFYKATFKGTADTCIPRFNSATDTDLPDAQKIIFTTGVAKGADTVHTVKYQNGWLTSAECSEVLKGGNRLYDNSNVCSECTGANNEVMFDTVERKYKCVTFDSANDHKYDVAPFYKHTVKVLNNAEDCLINRQTFGKFTFTSPAKDSCASLAEIEGVESGITDSSTYKTLISDTGSPVLGVGTTATGKPDFEIPKGNTLLKLNNIDHCNRYARMGRKSATSCVSAEPDGISVFGVYRNKDAQYMIESTAVADDTKLKVVNHPTFTDMDVFVDRCPNTFYENLASDPNECKENKTCTAANEVIVYRNLENNKCIVPSVSASATSTEYKIAGTSNYFIDKAEDTSSLADLKTFNEKMMYRGVQSDTANISKSVVVQRCQEFENTLFQKTDGTIETCVTQAECEAGTNPCIRELGITNSCQSSTDVVEKTDTTNNTNDVTFCKDTKDTVNILYKETKGTDLIIKPGTTGLGVTTTNTLKIITHKEVLKTHDYSSAVPTNPCLEAGVLLYIDCSAANTCTYTCSNVSCNFNAGTHTLVGTEYCIKNPTDSSHVDAFVTYLQTQHPWFELDSSRITGLASKTTPPQMIRIAKCGNVENFEGKKIDFTGAAPDFTNVDYKIWSKIQHSSKDFCLRYEDCDAFGGAIDFSASTRGALVWKSTGYECKAKVAFTNIKTSTQLRFEYLVTSDTFKVGHAGEIQSYIERTDCGKTIGTSFYALVVREIGTTMYPRCEVLEASKHYYDDDINYDATNTSTDDSDLVFRDLSFKERKKMFERAAADDGEDKNDNTTEVFAIKKIKSYKTADETATEFYFKMSDMSYMRQADYARAGKEFILRNLISLPADCDKEQGANIVFTDANGDKTNTCQTVDNFKTNNVGANSLVDVETSTIITNTATECSDKKKLILMKGTDEIGCVTYKQCAAYNFLMDENSKKCLDSAECPDPTFMLTIGGNKFCVTREQCINNRLGARTNQYLTFIKPGATTVRKCIPWESCKTEPDSTSNADTSYIDYDNLACTNSAPGNADLKVNLEITAGNSYGFWMEICPVIVFEKEGGQVVDSGVFDQCKRDSAAAVIDNTECPSTKYLSSYTNECLDACTPVFANDRTQNLMFKFEGITTPTTIRKLCVTAAECTMLQPNFAVELNFGAPASSECKAYDPVANTDKVISSDGIIGTEAECLAGKLFVADFLNPNFSYLIKWDNPERMNECRKRKDDLSFDCPAGTWKVLNSVFTTIPKAEEGCYDEPASRRLEGKLDLADALTLNNAGNAFTATCSNDQVKTKSIVGVGADTEPQAKVNRCVTRANFKDDASVELGLDMWYKTATITGTTYASESVAIDSCETGLGADPNFPLRNKTHECLTQAQCNQFTDYMFLNNSDAAKKECLPKQTFCNGTLIKAFLGAGTGKAECVPIDQCSNNGIDSSNYYVDFGETEISCKHKTSNQCIYEHYDNSVVTTATCFSYKTCSANNYYYRIEGTKSSCISRDTCLDGNDTKPLLEQKLLGKDFNTYNRCYTYDECYNTAEMFINPDTKECLTRTACENLCAGKTNCDFVVEDHFCYSQLDTETFFTEPVLAFTKGLKVYSEFCDFSLKIFEKKCVESCELFTNSAGTECYSKCEFCALTDGFERPRLCMDVSSVPADFNLIDYGNYNNRNNDCKVLTQSTNLDGMKLMNGEFYPCPDNKVVREGTTGFKCVNTCPDYTIDKGDFCESCNDNYRGKAEPEKDKFFGSSCVQTVPSSAVRVDISRNGYADCSELTDYALEGGICKQRCTQTGFGKKDGLCLNVNDITDSCIDEKTGNIITSSQCVSQGDTKCISGYCRIPAQCASNQLTRNNECLPCDSDSSFVLYNGQCISECPATNGTEPLIRSNGNCRTCNQVEPALVYNAESQACEISLSQNLCTGTWDSANNACDCIDVKTGPYCDTASLDGNTRAAQLVKEATEIVSNLSGLGIVTGSFTSKQRGSLITSINLSAYFAVNDSSSAYSVYSSNMTDLESSVAAKCEEAKQQYETSIDKNNATQEAVGKQGMDDICNLTNDIQKAKDILTNRDNKRTNVVNRNGNNGTASRNTSSRRLQQVENSPRVLQQASNEIIRNTVRSYLEVYSLLPERLEAASKFTRDTYLFYTHPVTQDEAKNEEYRTFMRSNKGNYLDLKTCSDSVFAAATGTPVAAFIEWINPLKASTASNEIEWHLFDSGTRGKLDLSSLCPGVETSFEVSTTLVADIDQELLSKYWRAAVSNIYDPRTRFFNDKCFQFSEDDLDYTVQMRRGLFPGKELLCGTDCRLGPLSDENSLECICVNRSASQLTLQDYTFSEYSKTDYIGSTLTCINEISSFEHINDSYVFWYFFIVGVILAIYWSFLFFVGSIEGLVAKHHSKLKDNNCLTKVEGREADKFVANYGMVGNINSAEGSDNNRKDENAAESERRVNSREQIEGNSDEHNESVGGIKIQTDVQLTKIDLDFIPIQKSVDSDMRGFVEYCWDKIRCNNLLISPLFSYSLVRPYHYRILELLVYMTVVGLFNYILWYDDYVHAISDNSGETVTAKIFAQFRHGWDIILYSILLAHVIKVFLANLLTPTQAKIAELTEPLAKEEKESIIAQYKKLFKRQLVLFGVFCAVGACLIGFTIYLCWVYASFYGNSGLNWLIRTILSAVIGLLVLQPLLAVLSFVAKELSRKVSFFRFFYYLARM